MAVGKAVGTGLVMLGSFFLTGMILNQHEQKMAESEARTAKYMEEAKKAQAESARINAETAQRSAEISVAAVEVLHESKQHTETLQDILRDIRKMYNSWSAETSETFAADAIKNGAIQ